MEDILLETCLYKAYSDSFDVQNISAYTLCMKVHQSCLSVGVFDASLSAFLVWETYQVPKASGYTFLRDFIAEITSKHPFLNAAFWKEVRVLVSHPIYSVVPTEFVQEEKDKVALLKLNTSFSVEKNSVLANSIDEETSLLFTVEKDIQDWFKAFYMNTEVKYIHGTYSFLDYVAENCVGPSVNKQIFAMTNGNDLTVCVYSRKLEIVNTFRWKEVNDLVYFILFVMDEADITPKDVSLTLWGRNEVDEETVNVLKRYIGTVELSHFPQDIGKDFLMENKYQHFDIDLFNVINCK